MYYTIQLSAEPSVIGVNNGVHQVKFDKNNFKSKKDYEKFDSFFYDSNYSNDKIDFKEVPISITKVNLFAKAKLTDFMGFTPEIPDVDFLINERVKKILSESKLLQYLLFKTEVHRKKTTESYEYYFFYYPGLDFEEVILKKSELYTRKVLIKGYKDTIHKIKNFEHYKKLNKTLLSPQFSKICVSSKYKKIDCINVAGITFISEKLKKLIEVSLNTGLEIGDRCELVFD